MRAPYVGVSTFAICGARQQITQGKCSAQHTVACATLCCTQIITFQDEGVIVLFVLHKFGIKCVCVMCKDAYWLITHLYDNYCLLQKTLIHFTFETGQSSTVFLPCSLMPNTTENKPTSLMVFWKLLDLRGIVIIFSFGCNIMLELNYLCRRDYHKKSKTFKESCQLMGKFRFSFCFSKLKSTSCLPRHLHLSFIMHYMTFDLQNRDKAQWFAQGHSSSTCGCWMYDH